MMLKCREVSRLVATDSVAEQGFMRRLELRLHVLMCRHCHRYLQQIRALGRGARELADRGTPAPERLQELEEEILEQVRDHPE